MFSDTSFWRLVWKEYRTHRPLWLVLLIATPLLQVMLWVLTWVETNFVPVAISEATANVLMAVGFIASVVYLLGCSATMFSVEHETGVFDFQRVLPANPPRVFWAKVAFALVSSLALTAVLWIVTRGVFLWDGPRGSTWFGTYGLLYMAEVFAWSILASLLIRQPLWGVIAAIALQSVTMQVVLPSLTSGRNDLFNLLNEDGRFTLTRFVVLALLLVADVVLGRLWFEDRLRLPRWRFRWKPEFAPSYATNVELPPYSGSRQVGWRRLLWLSWRDGRWVMAGGLAWYGYMFLTLRHPNDWVMLTLVSFVSSFVFGLFAFAPEQWGGRFRFLTERGCSPRSMWLCRQAVWLPSLLVMCVGTKWQQSLEYAAHPHGAAQAALEGMMAAAMPLVCYAAGQLTTMLFRSTVMAIAVGFGLCLAGGMWSGVMTQWLAPTWWAVGSLPVIGLFVTWLKANDWIEERRDRTSRWRSLLGAGIPIVLLLTTIATYRVIQIPIVRLPPEWDKTEVVLARLTAAEKETLAIYRRVLTEIEQGDDKLETYGQRFKRLNHEHPELTQQQIHSETFKGFHRDWLKQHAELVPLLREAHRLPSVPLVLIEDDVPTRPGNWNPERLEKLPWLMVRQAEQSRQSRSVEEAWIDIEVAFELQRRFDLRATLPKEFNSGGGMGSHHESYLLQTVARWGRRQDQTRERVLTAIRKLEEMETRSEAIQPKVHRELLESQSMLRGENRWKEFVEREPSLARRWDDESQYLWKLWNVLPWERWRSDRAVRLHAWLVLDQVSLASKEERTELLAVSQYDHNSTEMTILHATLLPPNLTWWGLNRATGDTFRGRATSFRTTMLLLALADFHREQGCYPRTLNELVPIYFAQVPRDPTNAGPFRYFPHGFPEDATRGSEERGDVHVVVRKEIPFLVTKIGMPHIGSRQKPDETWEFFDEVGKRLELVGSKADYRLQLWPVEEP